jgi:very-short-patch-repair endonuclease
VRNTIIGSRTANVKRERAYEFRREMTLAEKRVWRALRHNQLNGLHFRRQQTIAGFIVDFYCHAAALVVEIDGGVHGETREYDANRDQILASRGFHTLRVANEDVVHQLREVLQRIANTAESRIVPPSLSGKGPGVR